MKRFLLALLTCTLCLSASAELSKDQQKRLKDIEIAGVRNTTIKDDDRKKIAVMEINTFQNEDDQGEGFRIRIVAEVSDKLKKRYLVDFTGNRQGGLDTEYTGEDYWKLNLPYGELESPKITAYAIQYGFMDDTEFVVFAEKFDGVKSIDELLKRATIPFPGDIRVKHYYMYSSSTEGEVESVAMTVKQVKGESR